MPHAFHSRLPTTIALASALLLAACGSQAGDHQQQHEPPAGPTVATPPQPRAAAGGGQPDGTPATQATPDPAPSVQDDDNPALVDQDPPADDEAAGDDWPALRQVPGGTLTWTVVYDGTGTTRTSEMKEVATLHRTLHGTARLVGGAGNPEEAQPAMPLDDINRAMQACGDDMACQQAAAMRAVARVRKDPAALERGMRKAMTELRRDTTWVAASCSATGQVDDEATWSGMTPGGFNTGVGTRQGKARLDDCGGEAPRLIADDDSKTYRLALPSGLVRVEARRDGRVDPVPSTVEFPSLSVEGIRYARLDRPLKGSATLHTGGGHGIWSEGWDVPLTERVSWTFTPDAH